MESEERVRSKARALEERRSGSRRPPARRSSMGEPSMHAIEPRALHEVPSRHILAPRGQPVPRIRFRGGFLHHETQGRTQGRRSSFSRRRAGRSHGVAFWFLSRAPSPRERRAPAPLPQRASRRGGTRPAASRRIGSVGSRSELMGRRVPRRRLRRGPGDPRRPAGRHRSRQRGLPALRDRRRVEQARAPRSRHRPLLRASPKNAASHRLSIATTADPVDIKEVSRASTS
jgi:hypothetical protein